MWVRWALCGSGSFLTRAVAHRVRDAAVLELLPEEDAPPEPLAMAVNQAAKRMKMAPASPPSRSLLEVDGVSWERSRGPWYLRFDGNAGKHWAHCCVCKKTGDTAHYKSDKHQNTLQLAGVNPVPFQKSWDSGWMLGLDAPRVVSLEWAEDLMRRQRGDGAPAPVAPAR